MLVAFRETLTGAGHIPYDTELYHFPLLRAVQDQIASGSIPAWDPYTYGGTPLLANTQSAWAYPPHLLADLVLALIDRPLGLRLVQWIAVVHVWIAAAGTVLLVRRRGLGDAGAAFAGVFVVLCGAVVSQAQHLAMTETLAWLPLALVVVDRLREGVTARRVVALGGLFALMLTPGFIPATLACAALVAAYAAARGPRRARTLAASVAGPVLGGALAAVALLPVLALLPHLPDLEPHGSLPAGAAVTALIPNAFGHWLPDPAAHDGPAGLTASYYYVGAGALALLPLALARGREVLPDLVVAAVFALLAFGTLAAEVARPIQDLPGGLLYRPELMVYVGSVPLALVLAHGLRGPPTRRGLGLLAAFLVAAAVVPLPDARGGTLHLLPDAPRRMLVVIVVLAGLAALAFATARRSHASRLALGALALVAAAELTSTVPDRRFVVWPGPGTRADADRTNEGSGVLAFLRRATPADARVAVDALNLPAEWVGFSPVWRIENTNGFHPQHSKHLIARVRRTGGDFRGQKRILPVTPGEWPVFRELGVRNVVVTPASDAFEGRRGFTRVYEDGSFRVYRVEGPHSRAYTVDRACLELRGPEGVADCTTGKARVEQPEAAERILRLPPEAGGGAEGGGSAERRLLVTGEPWFPGWHAKAGGDDLDVERIGYLAATEVPAGATRVELRYRPPLLRLGAVISLLVLAGCALVLVRARRQAASTPRPTASRSASA